MANYDSDLSGAQIESALEAVNGLIGASNNGKIVVVENGLLVAKSAVEIQGGTIDALSITANGTYTHAALGGYSPITVNVQLAMEALTVTENGTYSPSAGYNGFSSVIVSVPTGTSAVAVIKAKYTSGYTCTCTNGDVTLTSNTSGTYLFCLPAVGTWTLTCNGVTASVTVTANSFETVSLAAVDVLKARCKLTDYVRLSNYVGDKAIDTIYGRWFMRDTNEPVLIVNGITNGYHSYVFISSNATLTGTYNEYGSLNSPAAITTSSGRTVYAYSMSGAIGNTRCQIKITTDGEEETMLNNTYIDFSNWTTGGTNASDLTDIIDAYGSM